MQHIFSGFNIPVHKSQHPCPTVSAISSKICSNRCTINCEVFGQMSEWSKMGSWGVTPSCAPCCSLNILFCPRCLGCGCWSFSVHWTCEKAYFVVVVLLGCLKDLSVHSYDFLLLHMVFPCFPVTKCRHKFCNSIFRHVAPCIFGILML